MSIGPNEAAEWAEGEVDDLKAAILKIACTWDRYRGPIDGLSAHIEAINQARKLL